MWVSTKWVEPKKKEKKKTQQPQKINENNKNNFWQIREKNIEKKAEILLSVQEVA